MPVSPAGMLSLPAHYLRETVAASAAFQAWVGVGSAAAALPSIHLFGADAGAARPLAVIDFKPGGFHRERFARAAGSHFMGGATLELMFIALITEAADVDAAYEFTNVVGAIVADMELLFGSSGYLDARELTLVSGPSRPELDEEQTRANEYAALFELQVDLA